MAVDLTIPSQAYVAGLHPFGPFSIASGSQLAFSLTRENWPDSAGVEIIEILVHTSQDGGVTWSNPYGFGAAGGTLPLSTKGFPQDVSGPFKLPLVTPCQIKGTVNLQQGLTTSIGIVIT
jgi:hypothetical protein